MVKNPDSEQCMNFLVESFFLLILFSSSIKITCLGSFVSARLKSQQVPPGTVCMQHLCGMHSESSIHAAVHLPYLSLFTHLWVPQAEISDKLAEALSSGDSGLKRYFFKKITGMFSIKLSRMTCVNLRVRCYVWTARW